MLSQKFKKLIVIGLPITLLATVIGCAAENSTGGEGSSNSGSTVASGMFSPSVSGNNYSVTLGSIDSGAAGAVVGTYAEGTCKSATSGETQSGSWSWAYDNSNPLIAMALNDRNCQLNIDSIKITGAGAGTYTKSAGAMPVSNNAYGLITQFCKGDCNTGTEVFAKAMISWLNGIATINLAYASDPTSIAATGTGSYLTTSTITNVVTGILPPDYATFTYTTGTTTNGFQMDADGYIQPTNPVTGSFTISGSNATKAQYYTIYSATAGGTLADQNWANPTFEAINADFSVNYNTTWENNQDGYDSIVIPLYTAPTTATTLTSAWGLMTPVANQGVQPCGSGVIAWCTLFEPDDGSSKVSNTYKSFSGYLIPTLVPLEGLVYYVVSANVDGPTAIPAFQVSKITILP